MEKIFHRQFPFESKTTNSPMKTTKTPKQKLGPNQRKWIKALRSGRYKQGRKRLRTGNKYCCLGVACKVFSHPFGSDESFAPPDIVFRLALISPAASLVGDIDIKGKTCLAGANDNGATFAEIADFCEAHPEAVFTEAR